MKLIKDILTEDDNITYCGARVAVFIALFTFIGFAGYEVYNAKAFKATDYGTGIMQILTGGAAIIGAKQFTSKKDQ